MHYLAVDREREGVELVGIVLEEAAEEGLEQEVVAAWEGVDEKVGLDLSTHMSTCHTL